MANEFIARKGLIVLANGATVTGSLKTQGNINATGYSVSASAYTGSFYGDGSNLTGITATGLDIDLFGSDLTAITVAGTDRLILSDNGTEGRITVSQLSTPLAGTGLEANAGTIQLATGSTHFISGARATISVTDTTGANGVNLEYNGGVISATLVNDTVTVTAGSGLTDGGSAALGSSTTLNVGAGDGISVSADAVSLDTSSAHFTSAVVKTLPAGTISSSAQFTSLSAPFTGSFSGSFTGDGSGLTGIASTLTVSGSTDGDVINLKTETLTINGSNGITTTITDNTVTVNLPLGTVSSSAQVSYTGLSNIPSGIVSSSAQVTEFLPAGTVSASAQINHDATTNYVANQHIDHSTVSITAGSGLSGGGDITTSRTLTLNTGSTHFTDGVKSKLNADGVVSSSAQIDVRQTTGIATIATTGSNTFTGVQTISNTTNSTDFTNGALIVQGGVGITKDVNISGSLTVEGLLTAVSMSTLYVTSSAYTVGTSRIILNDDDLVRFAGLSVVDSGSSTATGSILWDSLKNHWIYERENGGAYRSSVLIAGPKNYGTLGNEEELVIGRIPVATGGDHIDTNAASSSIYIDFANKKTYIEAGLYVTGSVTSSVGFSGSFYGDGSNLTGIATNLEQITANGATTPTQVVLNGGVVIHGVLYTSGSNLDVDAGTEVITTIATGSYDAAFFDYVVKKELNYRAGTVMTVWDTGGNIEYTDTSTNDLGSTAEVLMSADILNGVARLKATVSTSDWIVKTAVRAI